MRARERDETSVDRRWERSDRRAHFRPHSAVVTLRSSSDCCLTSCEWIALLSLCFCPALQWEYRDPLAGGHVTLDGLGETIYNPGTDCSHTLARTQHLDARNAPRCVIRHHR
jgi:hypothetical protein